MATLSQIGRLQAAPLTHEHDAQDIASWQPVVSRSCINPHFTDPTTGAVSRNAIPQVFARYGRTPRRVLTQAVRQVRLEWRNTYCQVDDPGEINGPNPVTLRASIEYPAGTWRLVGGSTAWSSSTVYNPGDQVFYGGQRFVAVTTTTAGQVPAHSTNGPWLAVNTFPVHWPGQDSNRRVVVQPGQAIVSNPIDLGQAVALLAGQTLAVNMLAVSGASTGRIVSGGDLMTGDFGYDYTTEPAPGSAADLVDSPITNQTSLAAGTPIPMPTVVSGRSKDPITVAAIGDSLFQGLYDSAMDGDTGGFVPRGLRNTQLYRMSVAGARADSLTLPGQTTTWRSELLSRFNTVLTDLGGNDAVRGDGTTNIASNVAMVKDRMTALWRFLARHCPNVWATSMTPWTASSDNWATVANQSRANNIMGGTNGLDGVWGQLRDWFADGAPLTVYGRTVRAGDGEHPLAGIADVGYAVIDPASGWKWKAGLTTDGMHPNAAGHALLAAALAGYGPALGGGGTMADLPAGTFKGHWSVPFVGQTGGGESKAITADANTAVPLPSVLVDTLTRTVVDGIGCTMNAGIFEPIVGGEWRFEFATQWMGGSSSMRAMYLREASSNAFGNLGSQGLVSDAMSSGTTVRLKARQRMALYVSNWTRGTTVKLWNDGMTHIRATWLGP